MRKAAVAFVFVALMACARATSGGDGASPSGPGGATAAHDGQQSGSGSGQSAQPARSFSELVGSAGTTPYKVSYRVSASAGGSNAGPAATAGPGSPFSATQIWYVSGERFRLDLNLSDSPTPTSTSIFVLPDGTFTCFIAPPAAAQCRRVSEGEGLGAANPGAAFDEEIRANPDAFGAQFSGTRQIAGTSASCYGLNGAAAGFGQATICYTGGGVPLFYQFDVFGLGFTMEATSFGLATDTDFRLPAQP
jgi:hypothetical protein